MGIAAPERVVEAKAYHRPLPRVAGAAAWAEGKRKRDGMRDGGILE